jgi:protein TonB
MARDLLGDVLRTADPAVRRRTWSMLPVSIAAHVIGATALYIIPLAADVDIPSLMRPAHAFVRTMAAPPAPDVLPPRGTSVGVRRAAAPITAAATIDNELPFVDSSGPLAPVVPGPPGVPWGVDNALPPTGATVKVDPPPAPESPKVYRVGGVIREPKRIVDVPPVYPAIAVAARKEGVVILEAMLDETGRVAQLKVLRSEPLLDAAALEAVRRWRYTPTLLNNVPVPVLLTVTVRFSLR